MKQLRLPLLIQHLLSVTRHQARPQCRRLWQAQQMHAVPETDGEDKHVCDMESEAEGGLQK